LASEDFSLFNAVQILIFKVSKKRNDTNHFVPFLSLFTPSALP